MSNNVRVTTSSPAAERVKTNTVYYSSNSVNNVSERPWTAYYVTDDEFFDILRIAYDESFGGSKTPWHPEDMYTNVVTVLEIVTNTLSNMANLKSGRQLKGIKE